MNDYDNSNVNYNPIAHADNSQAASLPEFFYSTGIYRHRVAGRIFMEAVFMAAEDLSRLENIARNIYGPIAKRHGVTTGGISKNLRDVRDTIMKYGSAKLLEEMTGSRHWRTENPYPHEIIEVFARYFRNHQIPHNIL